MQKSVIEKLVTCCSVGKVEDIHALIKKYPKLVNEPPEKIVSAFNGAIKADKVDIVQLILQKFNSSVMLHWQDVRGYTPLHDAVSIGSPNMIETLIKAGASVDVKCKTPNFDNLFVEHGLQHLSGELHKVIGSTPLLMAAHNNQENQIEVVKVLLKYGANVNAKNDVGLTPFLVSCLQGNFKVFEMFLEHNADLDCIYENMSLLHLSAVKGYNEIISLLLSRKVNINLVDDKGNTPLHIACEFLNPKTVDLLLDNNADVNRKNKEGNTPLHQTLDSACESFNIKLRRLSSFKETVDTSLITDIAIPIVKSLVLHGANVNSQNNDGDTAFHLFPYPIFQQFFLLYGFNTDMKNNLGETIEGTLGAKEDLRKDYLKLVKQIKIMKETKFQDDLSLYDFFHMDAEDRCRYAGNEILKKTIGYKQFAMKNFPSYWAVLMAVYLSCLGKSEDSDKSATVADTMENQSDDNIEKIISQIKVEDKDLPDSMDTPEKMIEKAGEPVPEIKTEEIDVKAELVIESADGTSMEYYYQ